MGWVSVAEGAAEARDWVSGSFTLRVQPSERLVPPQPLTECYSYQADQRIDIGLPGNNAQQLTAILRLPNHVLSSNSPRPLLWLRYTVETHIPTYFSPSALEIGKSFCDSCSGHSNVTTEEV